MANKILCVQISTNLINGKQDLSDIGQQYYNKLYDIKRSDGYIKPSDFWEIPLWITEIDFNVNVDLHVCTDIQDTIDFLLNNDYTYICFSILEVNKDIIHSIITGYLKQYPFEEHISHFILGGYIDLTRYKYSENCDVFKTIKEFIEYLGIEYKKGNSYWLFKSYSTIPRLTLSTGCLNHCSFCTIEKQIVKTPTHVIEQQVKAFKPLKFKLVYINDKTFGQCTNYKLLPRIYKAIKKYNKDFKGFIIQTTTSQVLKLSDKFIKDAHIKYIELGIETYNDNILKQYHKPSSEKITSLACEKIRKLRQYRIYKGIDIKLIPNIIIGIPEENTNTYFKTIDFLHKNKDIISHLNIYNLAIYDNTELSKKIKCTNEDKNELSVNKSSHKDKDAHKDFYQDIHKLGLNILGV